MVRWVDDKFYGIFVDKRFRDFGEWKYDLYDIIESEDGEKIEDKSYEDNKFFSIIII